MIIALDLIARNAPAFGGVFVRASKHSGRLDLPIKLVDGRVISYRLSLSQEKDRITVREEVPQHLPPFCPERHINMDGTFCLYYSGSTSLNVADDASAVAWMETVYRYLKLQERARVKRRWPNDEQWAHGEAAHHQSEAQKACAALGPHFTSHLSSGLLRIKERRSQDGRRILELWKENDYVFGVWEAKKKVVRQKQRCFCHSSGLRVPKRLRRCEDHAKHAATLVLSLRAWEKAEKAYWDEVAKLSCCGTCDSCPLARPSTQTQRNSAFDES